MPISDEELLGKVKEGLGLGESYHNPSLLPRVLAVKEDMLASGVTLEKLESNLGLATLIVGVNDLWNVSAGEVRFSEAYLQILLPKLMAMSMPEAGG